MSDCADWKMIHPLKTIMSYHWTIKWQPEQSGEKYAKRLTMGLEVIILL
jgi:hypothetical protein